MRGRSRGTSHRTPQRDVSLIAEDSSQISPNRTVFTTVQPRSDVVRKYLKSLHLGSILRILAAPAEYPSGPRGRIANPLSVGSNPTSAFEIESLEPTIRGCSILTPTPCTRLSVQRRGALRPVSMSDAASARARLAGSANSQVDGTDPIN